MSTTKFVIGRNVFSLTVSIMIIILGVISIAGGAAILVFNRGADAEGYHWSNTYEVRTSAYAFALKIPSLATVSSYARLSTNLFGAENALQGRWRVEPVDTSRDLFSGLSGVSDGINYLSKMETEEAVLSMDGPFRPEISVTSSVISGEGLGGPVGSALSESIWVSANLGKQTAKIDYQPVWDTDIDDKYLIITNYDGTNNVGADIQLGFKLPVFCWLPYRLIPLGVILCICGILLIRKRTT